MASKKKAYVPANILDKFIMQSGVLDAPIVCHCGHETTRRECSAKQEFYDDITYTNYSCPYCGAFIRCDSQLAPLVRIEIDDNADENEDSDYDNE